MKNKTKVLFALILAVALFASLFIPAFASVSPDGEESNSYINWSWENDGKSIVGDKTYDEFHLLPGYYIDIQEIYYYYNYVGTNSADRASLYTNFYGKNILVAEPYKGDENRYFASREVSDDIKSFLDISRVKEKASKFVATSNGIDFYWFDGMMEKLDSLDDDVWATVNVSSLYGCEQLLIRAYDTTESIYTVVGCVFFCGGINYYVDYTTLPNNCFDSEGNLSFRSGDITVKPISVGSETNYSLQSAVSMQNSFRVSYHEFYEYKPSEYTPPSASGGNSQSLETEVVLIIIFYVILAIVGVAMPVVPIVLGIMLPWNKKLLKPRGWWMVAIAGILWLLSAVTLIVVSAVILTMLL